MLRPVLVMCLVRVASLKEVVRLYFRLQKKEGFLFVVGGDSRT